MEVFTVLVCKTLELGLLSPVGACTPVQRVSIYADDVALLVRPTLQDLVAVREILRIFGDASGLRVNYQKSTATLIRGYEAAERRVQQLL